MNQLFPNHLGEGTMYNFQRPNKSCPNVFLSGNVGEGP